MMVFRLNSRVMVMLPNYVLEFSAIFLREKYSIVVNEHAKPPPNLELNKSASWSNFGLYWSIEECHLIVMHGLDIESRK